MYDAYPVLVSGRQSVQRRHIFWIVVPYLHQVAYFPIRVLRQSDADLHIDTLTLPRGNEVDLFRLVLPDKDLVTAPEQLQIDDISQCAIEHFPIIAQEGIFQRNVRQIVFFLRFQNRLALQIEAMAGVDDSGKDRSRL